MEFINQLITGGAHTAGQFHIDVENHGKPAREPNTSNLSTNLQSTRFVSKMFELGNWVKLAKLTISNPISAISRWNPTCITPKWHYLTVVKVKPCLDRLQDQTFSMAAMWAMAYFFQKAVGAHVQRNGSNVAPNFLIVGSAIEVTKVTKTKGNKKCGQTAVNCYLLWAAYIEIGPHEVDSVD